MHRQPQDPVALKLLHERRRYTGLHRLLEIAEVGIRPVAFLRKHLRELLPVRRDLLVAQPAVTLLRLDLGHERLEELFPLFLVHA